MGVGCLQDLILKIVSALTMRGREVVNVGQRLESGAVDFDSREPRDEGVVVEEQGVGGSERRGRLDLGGEGEGDEGGGGEMRREEGG